MDSLGFICWRHWCFLIHFVILTQLVINVRIFLLVVDRNMICSVILLPDCKFLFLLCVCVCTKQEQICKVWATWDGLVLISDRHDAYHDSYLQAAGYPHSIQLELVGFLFNISDLLVEPQRQWGNIKLLVPTRRSKSSIVE